VLFTDSECPKPLTSGATPGITLHDDGASTGHATTLIDAENNNTAGRAAAFRRAFKQKTGTRRSLDNNAVAVDGGRQGFAGLCGVAREDGGQWFALLQPRLAQWGRARPDARYCSTSARPGRTAHRSPASIAGTRYSRIPSRSRINGVNSRAVSSFPATRATPA